MSADREDEETIADTVVASLTMPNSLAGDGWVVEIGLPDEVEITTPGGQIFRLSVEEITEDEGM